MQGQFQSVFQHPADPGVELLRSLWERPRSRNPPIDGGDRGLQDRGLGVLLWIAWSGGIGVIAPGYRHTLKEGRHAERAQRCRSRRFHLPSGYILGVSARPCHPASAGAGVTDGHCRRDCPE